MFSTFSNAVAQLLGSKSQSDLSTIANDALPQDTLGFSSGRHEYPAAYPAASGAIGYDTDVQPQYGYHEPSRRDPSEAFQGTSFQIDDDQDVGGYSPSGDCHTVTGRITHLYHDYGLIDNSIHFKFDAVRYNTRPKVGAEVEAVVQSRGHEDVGIRATEVTISSGVDWSDGRASEEEVEWHIGKVTSADKGSGIIEGTVHYDQDALPYNFFPYRGDLVLAEILRNHKTGKGRVKTVRPLREKHFRGHVTHVYPGYGFIDGTIYFTRKACEWNYNPEKGDQVVGKAIEAEQSKGKWRAISVERKIQQRPIHSKQFPAHTFKEGEMMRNRNDVAVTVSGEFDGMFIGQEKKITAHVRNNGKECRKLLKCEAVCLLAEIKVSGDGAMDDQKENKRTNCLEGPFEIDPGSKVRISISVTASKAGRSVCQVILNFGDFCISRPVPIAVKLPVSGSDAHSSRSLTGQEKWLTEHALQFSGAEPMVYPGVRPAQSVDKGELATWSTPICSTTHFV